MSRDLQLHPQDVRGWSKRFDFNSLYSPNSSWVTPPYRGAGIQNPGDPAETAPDPGETALDFRVGDVGAYSEYNWETFYHAPTLIASLLLQNQKFADALTWLEYIFNPMDASGGTVPQRYWQFAPFNAMQGPDWTSEQIQNLLATLAADSQQGISDPETTAINWMNDPYDPHAVASVRVAAYGKATIMQFLDTLIAWGDWYYSQYTAEMVSYAEQLYVLADMLLGPRPRTLRLANASRRPAADLRRAQGRRPLRQRAGERGERGRRRRAAAGPRGRDEPAHGAAPAARRGDRELAAVLRPAQPQTARLLGHGRPAALQHQALPEPAGPGGAAAAVRAADQSAQPDRAAVRRGRRGPGNVCGTAHGFSVYLQKAVELTNDVRAYGALILSALEAGRGVARGAAREPGG